MALENWKINIDPVLLEAYELAMAQLRGENLADAKARISREMAALDEARKKLPPKGVGFGVDPSRFEKLGMDANEAIDEALFDTNDLSSTERLFFRLWANKLLNVRHVEVGEVIASRNEIPDHGFIIINGKVSAANDKMKYMFGPGCVFSLAEGLIGQKSSWDVVATTRVVLHCIQISTALSEAQNMNKGLKGVCRFTIMRILNLKQPPEGLL